MKQVRKLLAIVLSIAIVIGLIPVANGKTTRRQQKHSQSQLPTTTH